MPTVISKTAGKLERNTLPNSSIYQVCVHRWSTLALRPPYQRGLVWSETDKQRLIDSILRHFSIGKIFWREVIQSTGESSYEVVDGQQRLTSIQEFRQDRFPLSSASSDLAGKKFTELPVDERMEVDNYLLDIEVIRGATEEQIRDMFKRLQLGKALTSGERLKAAYGDMHDFVATVIQHPLFGRVGFKNSRDEYFRVAAQLVRLSMEKRICDVEYLNLETMFDDNKLWPTAQRVAFQSRIQNDLDGLERILGLVDTLHPNRALTLTLFWFARAMKDEFNVAPKVLAEFIRNFEIERRAAAEESDSDFAKFNKAIESSTGREGSLKMRHKVITARFVFAHPDLTPRDNQRLFSDAQRVAIYWRDKGQCQICKKQVSDSHFEVDHFPKAWKNAGPTSLSNGRTLCIPCHKKVTIQQAKSQSA